MVEAGRVIVEAGRVIVEAGKVVATVLVETHDAGQAV